jgi:hypothetical protein
MDNEDMNDPMHDLLASSLEGNALGVQAAVNDMLNQRTLDALAAMKVDVAQSIYGTYGSEEQEADMDMTAADEPEEVEDESEEDEVTDWEIPEDDDLGLNDEELDDLFNELEDLTDQEETEYQDNEEDSDE